MTPAMCGVAIEVPLNVMASVPVPALADEIENPGAARSGLSARSPWRGPRDENSETTSSRLVFRIEETTPGLGTVPFSARRVAPPPVSTGVFPAPARGVVKRGPPARRVPQPDAPGDAATRRGRPEQS